MNIISKRRKPLPYAQNSSKDSVGSCLGTLPAGRFGRIQCWEAIGDARREFTEQLKGNIIEYLEQNNDKVQDSGSIIDLSLFMLGRSTTQAKPTVMFVSEDKRARKEAFNMIKDSKIMEKYPGFELGHIPLTAEFENLEFLAGGDESFEYSDTFSTDESLDVFWSQSNRLEGRRIYFYTKFGREETPRTATAGGVITYRGKPMLLTVNHFLEPTQTIPTPSFVSVSEEEENSEDECEITGLSDFDDEDEDRLIEITSEGSITPEFETSDVDSSRSCNNKESVPSSGSTTDVQNNTMVLQERLERIEQNQASIPLDGASRQQFTRAGKVILRSKELDYSLVEIDHPLASIDDLEDSTIELGDVSRIEPCCRDAAVKATTPDGGIVGGALSGTPSYVRLPHSRAYVEVYFARFNRPFVPGDCGSWVRDALTGRLFGHVFAGSPTSGLTMIMPACRVFDDAQNILEGQSHGTGKNVVRELVGEVKKETHQDQDTLAQPPSSEIVYQEQSRRFHHFIDHLEEYQLEDIQNLLATVNFGVPTGPHMMERLATFKRGSDLSFPFPWSKGVNMAELTRQDRFKVLPSIINPSEARDKPLIEQWAGTVGGPRILKIKIVSNAEYSYRQGWKDYDYDIHGSVKVGDLAHILHKKKLLSDIIRLAQLLEEFIRLRDEFRELHSSPQAPRHYRHRDSKIDDFLLDLGLLITKFGSTLTKEAWRNDLEISGIDSHRGQTYDGFLADSLHSLRNWDHLLGKPPSATGRSSSRNGDIKPETIPWFLQPGASRLDFDIRLPKIASGTNPDILIKNAGSRLYPSWECCANCSAQANFAFPDTACPTLWDLGAVGSDILDLSRIGKESQKYFSGRKKISQRKSTMSSRDTLTFLYNPRSEAKRLKIHEPQTEISWVPSFGPLGERDQVIFVDDFSSMDLQMNTVWETARVISYLAKVADDNGKDLYFALDPASPLKHSSSATIELTILKIKTLDFRSRALELWDGL